MASDRGEIAAAANRDGSAPGESATRWSPGEEAGGPGGAAGAQGAVVRPTPPDPPSTGIPRKVIYALLAAVAVLGLGGVVADRLVTAAVRGRAPAGGTGPVVPAGAARPDGQSPPDPDAALHAPLADLLGLTALHGRRAPPFSLTDAANGSTVALGGLRGQVVVLSFANAACNDICPVLADELAEARALVGATRRPVTFLTVNSDPLALARSSAAILHQPPLADLAGWRFLTGRLSALNTVWSDYGISVTADPSTGVASHNDLLYFIGPGGTLAWSAVPFADESPGGTFSLPAAERERFARGIATYARMLAGPS